MLDSIHFAYYVGMISSYSNRIIFKSNSYSNSNRVSMSDYKSKCWWKSKESWTLGRFLILLHLIDIFSILETSSQGNISCRNLFKNSFSEIFIKLGQTIVTFSMKWKENLMILIRNPEIQAFSFVCKNRKNIDIIFNATPALNGQCFWEYRLVSGNAIRGTYLQLWMILARILSKLPFIRLFWATAKLPQATWLCSQQWSWTAVPW